MVTLILSACGTYNGKIKYQRVDKHTISEQNSPTSFAKADLHEDEVKGYPEMTKILQKDSLPSIVLEEQSLASDSKHVEDKNRHGAFNRLVGTESLEKLMQKLDPVKNLKTARAARVMGNLSFIPVIGWIFAIIAFILGGIALSRIKKDLKTKDGAIEAREGIRKGIISTSVGLGICLIIFLVFVVLFAIS
jgi:hypothetical protein